jgi:cell division protein FtsZ
MRVTVVATGLGKGNVLADAPSITVIQPEVNGQIDYKKLDKPTAIRQKGAGNSIATPQDKKSIEYLEIPAFLRRQAD